MSLRFFFQVLAKRSVLRRVAEIHFIKQRVEVKPGAAADDRHFPTLENLFDRLFCKRSVFRDRERLSRVDLIDQIMLDLTLFFLGRFCAADIHIFVKLHGIAGDDLSADRFRNRDGVFRFADGGRSRDHNDLPHKLFPFRFSVFFSYYSETITRA